MLIDFSLNYTPYIVIQQIQIWRVRRVYFGGDLTVDIVIYLFLSCLGLMRQHKLLLVGIRFSISHNLYPKLHNPLQLLLMVSSIEPQGVRNGGMTYHYFRTTPRTITLAGNFVSDHWNVHRVSA